MKQKIATCDMKRPLARRHDRPRRRCLVALAVPARAGDHVGAVDEPRGDLSSNTNTTATHPHTILRQIKAPGTIKILLTPTFTSARLMHTSTPAAFTPGARLADRRLRARRTHPAQREQVEPHRREGRRISSGSSSSGSRE